MLPPMHLGNVRGHGNVSVGHILVANDLLVVQAISKYVCQHSPESLLLAADWVLSC